ncbi:peptidoglycan DD-metalloendopeptidase family protein [Algoriphagus hitonicola]|uniref:Murein DD-endopeptidase MepM and murein hydrolase activator NlpD, contain LysM domain n=1 Tax=Algoriphagus hitonicola TaxID=435880 RepID=A0A1I2UQ68_9BACT|nr:peptidoglycan DD-metalloendopeptidase family protein [Algoriphagus hitonicola]SFG79335.1 Murein DD-endopeptidase MepM and murein hydrolase activator NlpD, contain LysM domain [Algoriphagus hitonicola]
MKPFFSLVLILFCLNSFAQIQVESERDKDGNVIITASNTSSVPHTLQFDFSNLQNLSPVGGGSPIGIANPGISRVATLKRENSSQVTNYSFRYTYIKGNIFAKRKKEPIYLIPVSAGTEVRGVSMTHIQNRLRPDQKNNDHVGVAFYLPKEVTIVAPRKGYISDMKMDYTAGKNDLDFSRSENFIEIYHEDGTLTQLKVLKANSQLVKIGQEVFPGDPIATSAGENYQNGRHVRVICTRVIKNGEGKIQSEIFPVSYVLGEDFSTLVEPIETTVLHTDEVITMEMSKRELKNRNKAK